MKRKHIILFESFEQQFILTTFKNSFGKGQVLKYLNLPYTGTNIRFINLCIEEYNIDTSHFKQVRDQNRKYEQCQQNCPICNEPFITLKDHPKAKQTCSYACSNTYFRSGINNGRYKHGKGIKSYRTICFEYHDKKCCIKNCDESNIVAVHHMDGDHDNDDPANLIPLCPTHHTYMHSKFKYLIEDDVNAYINQFKIVV